MQSYSKVLVWYKVASQQVILGEAFQDVNDDLVSLWVDTPTGTGSACDLGYHMSLFGDDGRKIADKPISMFTADQLLGVKVKMEGVKKSGIRA